VHTVFAEAQVAILTRLAAATVADVLATSALDETVSVGAAWTPENDGPVP
jgi:hypothetical protein